MSKELVISANRHETKVAILEDDQLVEVYFQRSNEYSLAGSIYKGRVTRVLPGMQSAFVDLGLERDTFLYVSDFLEEHEDFDKVAEDRGHRGRREREGRDGGRESGREQERREAAPAAKSEQVSEAAEAVQAEAPEGVAAAAAAAERGADQRERRGRRSRRRRKGGRGFPESKYAGAPAAQAEHEAEEEPPSGPEPLEALVLPGESIAKYRAAVPQKSEPQAPSETEGESEFEGVAEFSQVEEPLNRVAEGEEAERAGAGAPEAEAGASENGETENGEAGEVNEYDEAIHYPPENALPDAPMHATADEEESAVEAGTQAGRTEGISDGRGKMPAPIATSPFPTEEFLVSGAEHPEPGEAERQEAEAADEDYEAEEGSAPATAPLGGGDEEDSDIQAMILGDAEGIEIVPAEEESAEAETTSEGESGGAAVREGGIRYGHRGRRRRRGRGGPQAQQAAAEQGRGEPRTEERAERAASRPNLGQPSISDLLKEGQEIIVQIAKEPLGQKGARITSHIALPGRYVVYMPTLEHMGVSRKIASDEERQRLKRILQARRPGPVGGFITRTAAEGRTEEEIGADMEFLYNLWQDLRAKAEKKPAPVLLHHDLDIVQRILRDQLTDSFKAIWVDNEDTYESVVRFVERFQPALIGKVKLYTREAPIFDAFNITNELEKALRPKVWLKSGGFIVINQTEALVAIDVNTGKYVGKTNRLEDTIVKTNTEAIKEIVRQIRLRDLGGIIVIDFIDMDERKNRQKVMQALEEAMRADRAPYKILQFNDFGLVAITRKRVKQSLERTLCSPCPYCDGAGYIKSVQTVVSEILVEARKMAKSVEGKDVMLRVHPDVAKVLKSHQNKYLEELEEVLRRPVLVKSDPQLHHEKFDLA
jgi:ribonuclease G